MIKLKTSVTFHPITKFVYFGSSRFSEIVLQELEVAGLTPILKVTNAHEPLPSLEELRALEAEIFIVASFGKILPQELLDLPIHGSLNVHPSLLPQLRGPAPIQNLILGGGEPGVTIIKMDDKMDHGPILSQESLTIEPWPDHYEKVEEKLASAGGRLLIKVLEKLSYNQEKAQPQDDTRASYTKLVKKEDGLLNLADLPDRNWRKVLAFSTWPHAYFFFKRKTGQEIRVVVKEAIIQDGLFTPTRVTPAGKHEMSWADFLRGNA